MRFFQYSATDANGRPAQGTIRAATADSARDALVQAGYRVSSVVDPGPQAPSTAVRTVREPSAASRPPKSLAQPPMAPRSLVETPASIVIQDPTDAATPPATIKTKFAHDKDLFFLFSQLGQYYRAGVSPQTAMSDLAKKSRSRYQESLLDAEKSVGEGRSLSSVFAKYPYLYSPDIIGTLRAGEISGYLAEACEKIGDQKESSHRLKRRLAYFLILFVVLVLFFPISLSVVNGALHSMSEQDRAGGSLPIAGTLLRDVGRELLHSLPWTIPLAALVVGGLLFWHSMPMRDFRHRLVLWFPVLGGRVRAEAMARFTWALGLVSRGGTSPHQTFQLAAESVPSLVIRKQLMDAATTMTESERLSVALRRSGALPVEYSHIVETGETTGDVPRALADITRATEADFRGRDATAAVTSGIILYVGLGILTLVLMAILYRTFYGGAINIWLKED